MCTVRLALLLNVHWSTWATGPFEDTALSKTLHREARFGESAILDELAEAKVAVKAESLVLEQRGRALRLDDLGSVVIEQPALPDHRLQRAFRFGNQVMGTLDRTERLTHAAVACALLDAGHSGWKTREEYQRQPNSGTVGMADKRIVVGFGPPICTRQEPRHDPKSMADDVVHLLKRAHSPNRS